MFTVIDMKKDLSYFLLVSDIDGTLNNQLRKTPKVNTEAIRRFTKDEGGHFTLASARCAPSLYTHYKNLPDVTTPAIVLNGAGIYDFSKKKMLWYNSIPHGCEQVVEKALEKFRSLEIAVFTDEEIYLVRPKISSRVMMLIDKLEHKCCRSLSEVPKGRWGKIIFFCMPWNKEKIKSFVLSQNQQGINLMDTTAASFDIVNESTNKGNAVKVLAEILGIEERNIGAIGDYFNDYEMLKSVAHPACCAQAPEELHEITEFHACHCNKGAVADFISYIEKNY